MSTGLTEENYETLSKYRQARAHEMLDKIHIYGNGGYYNTATNRLYYACYYAAVVLLTKHRISVGTHAGVRMMLGSHFVSKGLITKESGRALANLFDCCQRVDYDELVSCKNEVDELYPKAQRFIEEIDAFLG